jgi:cell division protein FtsI (penicillin-binding protein 3)
VALVQRRIGALYAALFALLALAGARTLYLSTLQGAALRKAARTQQVTYEPLPAQRGTISDRNGIDLAVSEPAQDISATPYLISDPLSAAQRLAPLLGLSQDEVLHKLSEHSGFVYLARALPAGQAQRVLALKMPGISGTPVMRRVYPRGTLAAQVLGVVGGEGNGLAGLEYSADSLLHGRSGERRVVSDAVGHPVSISEARPESMGTSVSLTLDANVQQRTEEVLAAVGRVFSPKDATAIVMDPRSGAVISMASWPSVNANDPGASTPEALQNRAVGFDYEPGSTFKAITVAGALQQGLITPNSGFTVPNQIHVADRIIHDDTEHATESLTTAQILAQSSNVGAIEIGMLEGASAFSEWVRRFGFGVRTGVEVQGEEQGELLPLDKYSGSSMGNLPIGQGQLVTPLQMARGRRVISPTVASALRQMLEGVLAPGGTASEVSIPGYQLAGKTGTASKIDPATKQYSQTAFIASFIGFAPAADPKLLCAVVVDEPQSGSIYGGTVAAPAFGQIMSFALPYLGIPPG